MVGPSEGEDSQKGSEGKKANQATDEKEEETEEASATSQCEEGGTEQAELTHAGRGRSTSGSFSSSSTSLGEESSASDEARPMLGPN